MQRPLRRHGIAAGSCHPAGVRTLRSAGTSRSLPGRRELISENRLATQGKIATRYTNVLDKMLSANLLPGYVLSRAAVPIMLKQGHGVIVNVASTAAVEHAASAAAYAASKAAAVAMIDSLAADLKGTGVRANSILPSIIDTEANRKAMPNADFSKWPKPQDIARVILFLCGDDAKLIHGASIHV